MRQLLATLAALILIALTLLIALTTITPTLTTNTPAPAPTTAATTTTHTVIAAFDLDDCLLDSSPAFSLKPFSWTRINGATPHLCSPLTHGTSILQAHQHQGTKPHTTVYTYIITARSAHPDHTTTKALTKWLIDTYHVHGVYYTGKYTYKGTKIPKADKADILRDLAIMHGAHPDHCYWYGDSDSDIKAGIEAGYITYRTVRPSFSNYTKSNNPGIYNETIIPFSQVSYCNPKEGSMIVFVVLVLVLLAVRYFTARHSKAYSYKRPNYPHTSRVDALVLSVLGWRKGQYDWAAHIQRWPSEAAFCERHQALTNRELALARIQLAMELTKTTTDERLYKAIKDMVPQTTIQSDVRDGGYW